MTWNKPGVTCTTCHGAPPSTGQHQRHVVEKGIACSNCHGAGYSATTVNAATHIDGQATLTNRVTSWNATTGDCVGCHGAANWYTGAH
jgi:hypothetical protein